jgi:uroporphyrinogen decarboxylase
MRQAGRYLPEYRSIRKKYSLSELFHHPELAAQITEFPVQRFGLDAAILFSDILMIAEILGLTVHFPEEGGPYVEPQLNASSTWQLFPVEKKLDYVFKTIQILRSHLRVPLIGFCGGPFTVATYLAKKGKNVKNWLYEEPKSFHHLLQTLTDASIEYLRLQIESGVQAIQIFDSWANILTYPQFLEFSLPYLRQIVNALRPTNIPMILFCRGAVNLIEELVSLQSHAISFDWQQELCFLRKKMPRSMAIQGNFDPELLHAPHAVIRREVEDRLNTMRGDPGFIVNLGHGVLPDTPVENVQLFVETVKNFTSLHEEEANRESLLDCHPT